MQTVYGMGGIFPANRVRTGQPRFSGTHDVTGLAKLDHQETIAAKQREEALALNVQRQQFFEDNPGATEKDFQDDLLIEKQAENSQARQAREAALIAQDGKTHHQEVFSNKERRAIKTGKMTKYNDGQPIPLAVINAIKAGKEKKSLDAASGGLDIVG